MMQIIKESNVVKGSFNYPLFEHMAHEHNLILLESELEDIIQIVKRMYPPPDYTPSWLCRIVGHKWWLRTFNESIDGYGLRHRDVMNKQSSHCDRCGIRNPAYEK